MVNPMDLTNKKILVTGASSGIGAETSVLLSQLGAKVIMIARSEERLQQTLNRLEGKGHCYYCYDLSNIVGIEALMKRIIKDNGSLDGFVHSAGIGSVRPLKMSSYKFIKEVMDLNFFAFIEIIRNITKKNCYNEGMSIVGISSVASLEGNQTKTAYCASKAAMDASVRCIAKELAPKKIRVNSIMPAIVKTRIFDTMMSNAGDSEDLRNILAKQYLGIGEPVDIANMVAYLLSNAAKFISGSSIPVDGGRLTS